MLDRYRYVNDKQIPPHIRRWLKDKKMEMPSFLIADGTRARPYLEKWGLTEEKAYFDSNIDEYDYEYLMDNQFLANDIQTAFIFHTSIGKYQ